MHINDKVEIDLQEYEMTSCWDTPYGLIYLYTFKDKFQNIFIWKTSRLIDYDIRKVKGRIKGFLDYNNTKEIELTYCRCS